MSKVTLRRTKETSLGRHLSRLAVEEIRAEFAAGRLIKDIAAARGVSEGAAREAVRGITYASVPGAIPRGSVADLHHRIQRVEAVKEKFCGDCEQTLPVATHFHKRTRNGVPRPQTYCKSCMLARWHKWNKSARGSDDLPDFSSALMGWRNVAQCVPVGAMLGARL